MRDCQVSWKHSSTFSSVLRAGLGGWGWGTLYPRISSIFSAAFLFATFLLGPMPSADWPFTVTWAGEEQRVASGRRDANSMMLPANYLHDKLSASRQTPLCHHAVFWLLLLLCLLDLSQAADGIHTLAIFWAGLQLSMRQVNHHFIQKPWVVLSDLTLAVTLIMDLFFFLIRGSDFSTLGMWGSFFSSPSTAAAASFLAIFLLFPSPSPVNSPTMTRTTKLFMWGGPSSFKTFKDTELGTQ